MTLINLEDPRSPGTVGPAALALGFRPFFLLAALFAIAAMACWLLVLARYNTTGNYYAPVRWHSHEMLFGYSTAVIAGFLLTATRNWTGLQTTRGTPLALLALLWLGGRLLPFTATPAPLVAAVDLLFLPTLALALARPLLKIRQWRNVVFVPLLLLMAVANALVHGEIAGWWHNSATTGTNLMLWLIVLLIIVMGGRVIPFFTERGVQGSTPRRWRLVEAVAVAVVLLTLLAALGSVGTPWLTLAALAATIVHGVRLGGWLSPGVWRVPLVWVLHCGYGWVVTGLALTALATVGLAPLQASVHAFTAGGIGVLTLGMMARVSLGHTGRALVAPRSMVVGFVLVNLAALARVVAAWPSLASPYLLMLSAALWIAAFVCFAVVYAPILLRRRVDGRPG